MDSWKARGSASRGVMSLNKMPGRGKSGMSRMYAVRSMSSSRPGGRAPGVESGKGYELPEGKATMPLTIRRAAPADAAAVVEFNDRLARESEGKTLDPAVLASGVA